MPSWRRSKSGLRKTSTLKTHENWEGSISLPEDNEFEETNKDARKKLETSVAPAMPCKIIKKNCGSGGSNKIKTRLACILEVDESTRMRMGNSLQNHHEDHIAGKGDNSLQHYNLVDKFILMPQAMEIPAAKAVEDKEWENLENISAWNLTKVRSKKEVIDEAKDVGRKRSFCIINGHMSFEKRWIGGKTPKIQRSSCSPRWYCKRRFRVLCSIHWTRIINISNDSRQNHGYHLQIARLRRTRQYQLVPTWKWKMLTNYWKFQNRNFHSCGFVYHDTIGLNHGPIWKTQSFLLNGICTVILWQDCYGTGNLRRSYWNMAGSNFQIGNVSLYMVKKNILICVCGWHKIGWQKKTKTLIRCGNYSTKKSIWENQHLFSGSCILGMHSTTMWNKQRYCGQLQNHVRIENYRGRSREITNPSKSSHFFMVLWYGGSCKEVCGTILWVGKQDDSTTLQSIYSMHRWPPLQRRRNEICRRIVTCMLSNCSIMLKLGTNWTTWYSMVSK